MNNHYADLHLHSNKSDGSDPPAEVVARAHAVGIAAIAITDHDTTAGVEEAAEAARAFGIEFLSGVEVSASYGNNEVHVIGLGVDIRNEPLAHGLNVLRTSRENRMDKILERLHKAGIEITREEIMEQAGKADAVGRVHIAKALLARGVTKTVQDGFDRYIGRGKKGFVPKKTVTCRKAVDLIHGAGGIAILAHPGVGKTVQSILPRLLITPFDGIEAYHIDHTPGQITQFLQVATERGLLISGGSDCHGAATGHPDMGKVRLPYEHFAAIKQALAKRNEQSH